MAYFLRQETKKKGVYLQMYYNYWDKEKRQPRSKCIQSFGYVSDLISDDIPDPVAYFKNYVQQENIKKEQETAEATRPRAFAEPVEKNIGYFLLHSLVDELGVKENIDILASVKNFRFSLYDMISQLIYSRVICPCSKSKTASAVFPKLYNGISASEDQVYDACEFIGKSYKKYIELFNHCYEKHYKRNYGTVYFDCTNYYFEIDRPAEDKQKGPSKENRHEPIIGQALLLDSDLIPIAMQMYPGNKSEKPYIRQCIEEMKSRYKISGRTVQVADKGLNCARNIYSCVKEANDGYIFSKSIHGKGLSRQEKEWLLLENSANVFENYYNDDGSIKYRLKSCVDTFTYSFTETDSDTGEKTETKFRVKEKRVVSYNPNLAKKQKAEILKMAEKAADCLTFKRIVKEDLGDCAKYISVKNEDKYGRKIKPEFEINQDKISEDLKLAGYNLIVTSELNMSPSEIYRAYHNLWKIEESFRITKSYLDARPVFVQKKETIYGHFLICYLSLFLLRVLEIKCFKSKISSCDIINFIRDFRVADKGDGTYINLSGDQCVNEKFKSLTGISNLDALFLKEKEIRHLFSSIPVINN